MAPHDQPVPVPLANVNPAGSVSVTVMVPPSVVALPPLVTTRENCAPCWPSVKLPMCDFAMVRSGNCVTVTMSVFEVLLLVLLSVQVHATAAVLLTVAAASLATFTFSVMVEVPFTAIGVPASVQVTFCPTAPHDHPVPVPLANVSPVGSVSVTVIVPVVAANPPLVTTSENCAPCCACVKLPVWLLAMVRSGARLVKLNVLCMVPAWTSIE